MQPYRIQYVMAHPVKISMSIGGTAGVIVLMGNVGGFSIWAIIAVVTGVLLFAYLGVLILGLIIVILAGLINGAPFKQGELVHVLSGPHMDRAGRVYEIWEERNQVRVDLGDAAQEDCTDVFSEHEICLEPDA